MEKINVSNEIFKKISEVKKEKNLNGHSAALDVLITDLENSLKAKTEDAERWQNGLHAKNHEIDSYKKRIIELEEQEKKATELEETVAHQNEELKKLRENIGTDNSEVVAKLEAEKADLQAQLDAANQRANKNGENSTLIQIEVDKLREENEILKSNLAAHETNSSDVTLTVPAKNILEVVAARLSERYGKPIQINDIVDKMILRYNIEQYTSWFYPFVIEREEIESLTGKTRQEWLKFFNGVE